MFKVDELLKAIGGRLVNGPPSVKISGISIDSRTIKGGEVFVAIKGKNFDGHRFIDKAIKNGASCIIKKINQGKYTRNALAIPAIIEVADTEKALGGMANFQRRKFAIPVIGVTGSNGKTTCKEMIARVLSKKFKVLKNEGTKNNQIGLPLALLRLDSSYDLAVLELGTNHFGEINSLGRICEPNIGVITNIANSHLEHFHSLEGILREKYSLIENLRRPYIAILNSDDNLLRERLIRKNRKIFTLGFGIKNQGDFFASNIEYDNKGVEFLVNRKYRFKLKSPGLHNIYNSLAALCVASIFGIGFKDAALRLANFTFPEGRFKFRDLGGACLIDDTYNSNPFSLEQALNALENLKTRGKKIFVMGDMLELGRHKKLFHLQAGRFAARVCDTFITVGALSRLAAGEAKRRGLDSRKIFSCSNTSQAREILFSRASLQKGDTVLVKGSRGMKMEEVFRADAV